VAKKSTLQDIANVLNTNVSTVSRALNGHPAISETMKQRVAEVADKLNYSQNRIASSLRSGSTKVVGVIVPNANLSFFASVIHGIEKVMTEAGYNVILYQSGESLVKEVKGINTLLQSRVDGIISSMTFETKEYNHFQQIIDNGTPLILFDRINESLTTSSVSINDRKGGFIATEHLINQGYKKIAYISAKQNIGIFRERLLGYRDALEHYKLTVNEEHIVYGEVSLESGKACVETLFSLNEKPDAIVAVEDFSALGAMLKLKELGIKIPEEVGIIGFANEALSAYLTPSLSTIDQQSIKMGQEAALLFLEESKKSGSCLKKVVLEPILIVRESSKRLGTSDSSNTRIP
jgi:LacI family transcriptional regulator